MSVTSKMFMYSLTLQPAAMITQSIVGNFNSERPKEQQIILAQGERLTMNVVDRKNGEWRTLVTQNCFGILRSIVPIRIPGTPNDLIICSSDSGRIAVLRYDHSRRNFVQQHLETFGKSGIRRTIPGQYLAADPRGRCCMFSSVEKNKVVYILNRNQENKITISSPQEVNQPQTLTFALIAVDASFANPVYAALEVVYTDIDQDPSDTSYEERKKYLVYYRVDLGLNHVLREWSDEVDYSANMLFAMPGGNEGPSGVIVCAQDTISYRHPDHDPLMIPIPRRRGATEDPTRKRIIVSGVTHKIKGSFFLFIQTDDGDVFKMTMRMVEDDNGRMTGEVSALQLQYFDTFPVATTLVILKSGYLFLAAENGDSHVFRFLSLGDEIEPIWTSDDYAVGEADYEPIYFDVHEYENVDLTSSVPSLNPQKHTVVEDIEGKDEPRIITTAGTGNRSSIKTITNGISVNEHTKAQLPSVPEAIWAVSNDRFSQYDKYMVLAFSNVTMFLEVGAETKEVHDHGLRADVSTIHMGLMGDYGLIQVWDRGFRYYTGPDNEQPDWTCPAHRTILKACSNHQQLCLALSSGEILYFEVSSDLRTIQEYNQGPEPLTVSGNVQAMSMGDVPEGRVRAPFLVIGADDSTIRVYSTDPDNMLASQSIQSLTSPPRSIELMSMEDSSGVSTYVHVGLFSGVYLRAVLDDIAGELSNVRSRFLGAEPVKLTSILVNDQPVMLACGARTFASYPHPETKEFLLTPLDYYSFHSASMLRTEIFNVPQAIVALKGSDICIFSIPDMTSNVLTKSFPLQHTPRGFVKHPDHRFMYTVQSDSNTLPKKVIEQLKNDSKKEETNGTQITPSQQFRWPRGNNYWSSCIQVVDVLAESDQTAIKHTVELEDNEAALCCAMIPFDNQDGETFFLVGTGRNMPTGPMPPTNKIGGSVHVYRVLENGDDLEFIHKTAFDSPVFVLLAFQGRLLTANGNELFIYDLGMRSLLRKSRCRLPGQQVVSLNTQGSRIIAGDIQNSVFYVIYKHTENKMIPFADDSVARWTTTTTMLDYDTVAGGDKFGNLWIVRCPKDASDESDEPGAGNFLLNERAYLGGTPHRLQLQLHNYVQDIPTSIQKTTLVAGGQEILFWAGLQGTLGILVPFVDREDVEFFSNLEGHLRTDDPPLAGRDHLMYRSYYMPVKGSVDGDLCERFFVLPRDTKERIAAELDRSVREVEKKIGEMRTRVAF